MRHSSASGAGALRGHVGEGRQHLIPKSPTFLVAVPAMAGSLALLPQRKPSDLAPVPLQKFQNLCVVQITPVPAFFSFSDLCFSVLMFFYAVQIFQMQIKRFLSSL